MTAAALAAAPGRARDTSERPDRQLDQAIDHSWELLMRRRPAVCPVCGGEMCPEYGTGARPVGGRCGSCRSRLT